ncbi:hypothetical protein HG531_011520 [Fusarium graminearum]|nr:hypothetical protein HG531_011520 [Fusarium graminearum]
MGCLNHGNVVCSIADSEKNRLLLILLDQLNNKSFLKRRHTTADDGFAHDSQVKEHLLQILLECHHILAEKLATHTDIDGSLLSISSKNPDLDVSLLQSVDCLGNTILKTILNGSGAKQEKVLLNDFRGLVDFISTVTTDRHLGSVVNLVPFLEFVLWNFSHGQTQCSQTLRSILFKMSKRDFDMGIVFIETL